MAKVETNIRALTACVMMACSQRCNPNNLRLESQTEKASTYKVPTRAMAGNGDIRDIAVNDVIAVDRNGLVDHDGECL